MGPPAHMEMWGLLLLWLVDLFLSLKWTLEMRLQLLCPFGFKWTKSISQSGEIDKSGCCDELVWFNSSLGLSLKPVTRLFSSCPNLSTDSQYYKVRPVNHFECLGLNFRSALQFHCFLYPHRISDFRWPTEVLFVLCKRQLFPWEFPLQNICT